MIYELFRLVFLIISANYNRNLIVGGREYVAREQEKDFVDQRRLLHRKTNLLVTSLAEGGGEPLKTLVETVTRSGASGLDVLF